MSDSEVMIAASVLLERIVASASRDISAVEYTVKEASERYTDQAENFDGWLNLTLNNKFYFDFTLQELKLVQESSRIVSATNEIAKNVVKHYRNHIVGPGLTFTILPIDEGDPDKASEVMKKDSKIKRMEENWRLFEQTNKMHTRYVNGIERAMRDGELFSRVFKGKLAPTIRFVDPVFITSNDSQAPMGVFRDEMDFENIKAYGYKHPDGEDKQIKAEEIVHYKRNVDIEAERGLPDFYPVFTNLRRLEKLLVNTSALTQVQSAIALIRKHENSNQAQVNRLISSQSDGQNRRDTITGRTITGRRLNPGTILDAPKGVEYDFPAHKVNAESFLGVVDKELAHVAANFVLPVSWLLSAEPPEPLSPGSPTVANFRSEQADYYNYWTEVFWRVQSMMGIDADKMRTKYIVLINGPRLAVGKAIDEARIEQIAIQCGASSPQQFARNFGRNYRIVRPEMMSHVNTLLPGEVLPGAVGATSQQGQHDGTTDKNAGTKPQNAGGGDTGK